MDPQGYYAILGFYIYWTDQSSISMRDIKRAYYKLALIHHPDKNGGTETPEWNNISQAYNVLSNERLRYLYDNNYYNDTLVSMIDRAKKDNEYALSIVNSMTFCSSPISGYTKEDMISDVNDQNIEDLAYNICYARQNKQFSYSTFYGSTITYFGYKTLENIYDKVCNKLESVTCNLISNFFLQEHYYIPLGYIY
jgi:DnaJ-class molecular chaperone